MNYNIEKLVREVEQIQEHVDQNKQRIRELHSQLQDGGNNGK